MKGPGWSWAWCIFAAAAWGHGTPAEVARTATHRLSSHAVNACKHTTGSNATLPLPLVSCRWTAIMGMKPSKPCLPCCPAASRAAQQVGGWAAGQPASLHLAAGWSNMQELGRLCAH